MIFFLLILISFPKGVDLPYSYNFNYESNDRGLSSEGLSSNTIIDFDKYSDQIVFMGTTCLL